MDVFFLLLPDVHLLDMAGPVQAIHECNEIHGAFFRPRLVCVREPVSCWQGPQLGNLEVLPDQVPAGSLVFVCGMKLTGKMMATAEDDRLIDWLQRAHGSGATVAGICTGTFVLGRAGLLDGRYCTTHHRLIDRLRQEFPQARVIQERIFVEDGNLLTSAGVTAGIDLTLHLIARFRGSREAIDTARELVVHSRRMGEDPQVSEELRHRNHVSPLIHEVQDHMMRAYREPLTVALLARHHRVSARHLQRLFKNNTGLSIKSYLTALRLERARALLMDGRDSIELVAEKSGFSSTRAFRDAWMRRHQSAPSQSRQHLRHESGGRKDTQWEASGGIDPDR